MKFTSKMIKELLGAGLVLFFVFALAGPTTAQPRTYPFAAFNAKVEIEDDEFELKATFTLGAGSDGIDPLFEDLIIDVWETTTEEALFKPVIIPAGFFIEGKKGRFKFEGTIGGVALETVIRPLGGNSFEFESEMEPKKIPDVARRLSQLLEVAVGFKARNGRWNYGVTTVTAEFEDEEDDD